ncbi:uncharacterized protein METZ01_LOCUS87923 [marine metagenome]|uniref:Uncharacterized protein n=1 Tax=marine metagenome TaxID=408172 RepID=A0A381V3V3_9ZZZZ
MNIEKVFIEREEFWSKKKLKSSQESLD